MGRGAEHTGLVLQTPISIFQRIQKDGASALKEILPKTKLWIPGNGGLQAYKQAGTFVSACQSPLFHACVLPFVQASSTPYPLLCPFLPIPYLSEAQLYH